MEIKLLSCPLCMKPHFEGVDALRSTLVSVATSHLTCPVCSETLLGLDKLTIHLFGHINSQKTTDGSETLKSASQDVVQDEINKSIENISKKCKRKEDFRDNVSKEDDVDVISCDICSFTFADKNILEMHQKLLHQTSPDKKTGSYSYHCHLCSKRFKMRGSLMVHLRVAHYGFVGCENENESEVKVIEKKSNVGKETKPSDGDVEAKDGNGVKTQVFRFGNGYGKINDNKQWECDVCSKMFTTKYFLKKHKRLHTGEMPYCCTLCNKSFTFQQSYHKHMLYHSSDKPYVCNECGRAFKELSTLQNHARIHSGERPFGCETCGKRFRQRVSYLVHRRIHTGVMPYICTACQKSFRYKVSQRSHKCPMNPPGSVIRIPEAEATVTSGSSVNENGGKCIMSVDLNTGKIDFVSKQTEEKLKEDDLAMNNDEQIDIREKVKPEKDMFSMSMSPVLPEVESLCLNSLSTNNSPVAVQEAEKNIEIFGEEYLEDFLYGNN